MKPFAILKFSTPFASEVGVRMVLIEDRETRLLVATVGTGMTLVPTSCYAVFDFEECDAAETLDTMQGIVDEVERTGARFPLGVYEAAQAFVSQSRLKDAAGDLLAACEAAEFWLRSEAARPGEAKPDAILATLRAAIANAGGAL